MGREVSILDWGTYCEVKDGWILGDGFARLAHFIERSGYDTLRPVYSRSVTHAAYEITSVTRNGQTHTISDDASAGPLALSAIRQAIAGPAASATVGTGRDATELSGAVRSVTTVTIL